MEIVITFETTNYAILAERIIIKNNIHVMVMPLPPSIKAGCGICLRIEPDSIEEIKLVLEGTVEYNGMYKKIIKDGSCFYELVV